MRLVWVVIPLVLFGIIGVQESFTQPSPNLKITDLEGNSFSNVRSGQQVIISHNVSPYYFPLQYDVNCVVVNLSTNCSPEITKPYVMGDEIIQGNVDDQPFAIIFQIQNQDGITVYLSWIEGRIHREQFKTIETIWTPQESGSYTTVAFVWSAIDNPTTLAPPASSTIHVLEAKESTQVQISPLITVQTDDDNYDEEPYPTINETDSEDRIVNDELIDKSTTEQILSSYDQQLVKKKSGYDVLLASSLVSFEDDGREYRHMILEHYPAPTMYSDMIKYGWIDTVGFETNEYGIVTYLDESHEKYTLNSKNGFYLEDWIPDNQLILKPSNTS